MNLHRTREGAKSDWEGVSHAEQSFLQKIAHATRGILTPGNIITAIGLYLVLRGLFMFVGDESLVGTVFVIVGRFMDLFDGIVADATKTKSFVGATMDETADMIQLGTALVVLGSEGVIPLAAAILVAAPKALNASSSLSAKLRKKRMYPTGASKIGTAVLWVSLGFFMLNTLLSNIGFRFDAIGWGILIVGLILTVPSTLHYMNVGLGHATQND